MINREIAETNFKIACRMYDDSKEIIRELTTYAKVASPNFSFEVAMKQYDLLLQGILLKVALEDGYFLEEERLFIEKLTDYCDIMSFLRSKGVSSASWDLFDSGTNEDQKELSTKILAIVLEIASDFITPFAIVDAVFPKDYCKELTDKMGMICLLLAGCDADSEDSDAFNSEGRMAAALVQKFIIEEWHNIESKVNKDSSQEKNYNSARANSLKENYLKKKSLT